MLSHDILIIGSGIVGAATALSLAKKTSLQIALLDAKPITSTWNGDKQDQRVSAISLTSQQILKDLDGWQAIQNKRISSYQKMFVWDENGNGELEFDCRSINKATLGYIIEDNVIRSSLVEACQQHSNIKIFSSVGLASLHETTAGVTLITDSGETFQTKLLIGADGANSWVREQAKIVLTKRDYAHHALVTTVKTELPHQATAWQRFLTTGPLAFLPLPDPHSCSIVWSTSPTEAGRLLALTDAEFQKELTIAFDNKLGTVTTNEKRYSFELQMRHVKNYVKPGLALIGDAAHTIHPLAGQGVNLGLLDGALLVDVVVEALKKNRNYASFETLRCYERARKADNTLMLNFVEGIKHLFASNATTVKHLRNFGMNITNKNNFLKNFFVSRASGIHNKVSFLSETK